MNGISKQRFGPVESCLDYQSYVYRIDPCLTLEQYSESRRVLLTLGRAEEERMGVTYVRGPWGFFVIPQYGYPTLRVSFFHDTPNTEISGVLNNICAAFESSMMTYHQGGLNE